VTQFESALAVHWHSLSVAMVIVPDPPADVMRAVLTLTVSPHRAFDGPSGVTEVDEELQPLEHAATKRITEQRRRTPPTRVIS